MKQEIIGGALLLLLALLFTNALSDTYNVWGLIAYFGR